MRTLIYYYKDLKNFSALPFLTLFTLFFISCSSEQPKLEDELKKKWTFLSAINQAEGPSKNLNNSDYFLFSGSGPTGTFKSEIKKDGKSSSGEWVLTDSLLTLTYDLDPFYSEIDSTSFAVVSKEPVVLFYNDGKELSRLQNASLVTEKKTHDFIVSQCSKESLTLIGNGQTYSFSYIPATIYQDSFSLMSILRGILGLLVLTIIAFVFSNNKKAINWNLVLKGTLIQIVFAICILKVPFIQGIFENCSKFFVAVLSFTREGSSFVFGGLVSNMNSYGFIFAFQVLPTILFFSALTSVLFYLGVIQKIVYGLAWVMKKAMRLSGAESLAAAGNIFLGQTEAPLLIKPYIGKMTRSEVLCLMSGGMATIAGGVLAAYIGFLGGDDPAQQLFFAKHLLAASLMSAPAAIVAAKIILPETEEIDEKLEVSKEKIGDNILESIANGTVEGLKLAVNVGAMLVVFIAFIAMINFVFKDLIGEWFGLNETIVEITDGKYKGLTLQYILGYILKPLAWLLGTDWADSALVGQLLGEKTILNEFVAYVTLGELKQSGAFVSEKSVIIATYILCGFANFASIGIQIGGIGTLAPNKRTMLSQLGIKALVAGTIASLYTAVIVGMFY